MGGLRTFERLVKKIRGKDVPELEMDIPQEIKNLLYAIDDLVEREAIELVKRAAEKAWDYLQSTGTGIIITREQFDAAIKAVVDEILK